MVNDVDGEIGVAHRAGQGDYVGAGQAVGSGNSEIGRNAQIGGGGGWLEADLPGHIGAAGSRVAHQVRDAGRLGHERIGAGLALRGAQVGDLEGGGRERRDDHIGIQQIRPAIPAQDEVMVIERGLVNRPREGDREAAHRIIPRSAADLLHALDGGRGGDHAPRSAGRAKAGSGSGVLDGGGVHGENIIAFCPGDRTQSADDKNIGGLRRHGDGPVNEVRAAIAGQGEGVIIKGRGIDGLGERRGQAGNRGFPRAG